MSQKGLDRTYVERVNGYLAQLDVLMPNSERVAKMYRFLRETLVKVANESHGDEPATDCRLHRP